MVYSTISHGSFALEGMRTSHASPGRLRQMFLRCKQELQKMNDVQLSLL